LKKERPTGSVADELLDVLGNFTSYRRFMARFDSSPPGGSNDRNSSEGPDEIAASRGLGGNGLDPVAALKHLYKNKASHLVVDFMCDVMMTNHDAIISQAVNAYPLKDIKWLELSGFEPLREIYRLLTMHRIVIEVGTTGCPPTPARVLGRTVSDPADAHASEKEKERAEAWCQAQTTRKKWVHIGVLRPGSTRQVVQQVFENSPNYHFQGKPGEAHRVFLLSAELFGEARNMPWGSPAELGGTASELLAWLVAQTGPTDVLIFGDGRSVTCRKMLEKAVEACRNLHEAWIVYRPTKRLGRKVAYSSDNKEILKISMPVSRTLMVATPREDTYNAAGEESSHDTTYTGVESAPWASLPRLSVAGKESILGFEPEKPKEYMFDSSGGLPLFWQERKTAKFWI
jgi:hypothetical protein